MVEVTIESNLKNQNSNEKRVHRMPPCNLAFVVCITPREEYYQSNAFMTGGRGLNTLHASISIADCTVRTLIDLAGDSKKRQAAILASYMKEFVDTAAKAAGTDIMENVTKLVKAEE